MITVSTTSRAEAEYVARVLRDGLPGTVPYSVYLNGKSYAERESSPADREWPPETEER